MAVTAIGPNTMSPVKNQERSRWLKERWKGGGKGSDTGDLSALRSTGRRLGQDADSPVRLQDECQAGACAFEGLDKSQ